MIKLLATCAYCTDYGPISTGVLHECQRCRDLKLSSRQKRGWHLSRDCKSANMFQQVCKITLPAQPTFAVDSVSK